MASQIARLTHRALLFSTYLKHSQLVGRGTLSGIANCDAVVSSPIF